MSKRLQVLMDNSEFIAISELAKKSKMTIGGWVRQVLRSYGREASRISPDKKLQNISRAAKFDYPASDINNMLSEIEKGYSQDVKLYQRRKQ